MTVVADSSFPVTPTPCHPVTHRCSLSPSSSLSPRHPRSRGERDAGGGESETDPGEGRHLFVEEEPANEGGQRWDEEEEGRDAAHLAAADHQQEEGEGDQRVADDQVDQGEG